MVDVYVVHPNGSVVFDVVGGDFDGWTYVYEHDYSGTEDIPGDLGGNADHRRLVLRLAGLELKCARRAAGNGGQDQRS
jgi:hypothetical protein